METRRLTAITEAVLCDLQREIGDEPEELMRAWAAREIRRYFSRPHIEAQPSKPVPAPPGSPIGQVR